MEIIMMDNSNNSEILDDQKWLKYIEKWTNKEKLAYRNK